MNEEIKNNNIDLVKNNLKKDLSAFDECNLLQERIDLLTSIVNEKDMVIISQKKRIDYLENLTVVKMQNAFNAKCIKKILKKRCYGLYVFLRKTKSLLSGHGFKIIGRL